MEVKKAFKRLMKIETELSTVLEQYSASDQNDQKCRVPVSDHRHQLPAGHRVEKTSVLGGLHHEYRLEKEAA